MKKNENFTSEKMTAAINECARILTNDPETWTAGTMWQSFGPLGVMSPISRAAFVENYGESQTEQIERSARAIIENKRETFAASNYSKHAKEADDLQGVPTAGGFFWANNSGLKCDGGRGLFDELESLVNYTEGEPKKRLCKAEKVVVISPEEFDRPETADELVKKYDLTGGDFSEDLPDNFNIYTATREDFATFYTVGAVVTDGARWFFIDSEGFDYARYIYIPTDWAVMYSAQVSEIETERKRIEEQARLQAEKETADRLSEYKTRCEKWSPLMQEIAPFVEEENKARKAPNAWRAKSEDGKKRQAAERATNSVRKNNILAMCRAAFPGVKFSCKKGDGWGEDYRVEWVDGPTVEEFDQATDLQLFTRCVRGFDGYTDCTTYDVAEFTDFANKYMGLTCGEIKTDRAMSDEWKAKTLAEVKEIAPEASADKWVDFTPEHAAQIAEKYDLSVSAIFRGFYGSDYNQHPDGIVRNIHEKTSLYASVFVPAVEITTKDEEAPQIEENDCKPADGLELVEIAGGVAVVGDMRTTYRNRKEIKAHGAKWNAQAQQWQAKTPETIKTMRDWFAA